MLTDDEVLQLLGGLAGGWHGPQLGYGHEQLRAFGRARRHRSKSPDLRPLEKAPHLSRIGRRRTRRRLDLRI